MLHLRCSRSSVSTMSTSSSQQTLTTPLDVLETRSGSGNTTTSTLESMDTRILLERLKVLNNDNIFKEHRQILDCIYRLVESAWTQANLELENNQIVQKDGVLVGMFIPSMTRILQQTIMYLENNVASPSSRISLSKNKQKTITKDLETFRNKLENIYSFAMPDIPLSLSSGRTEDALAIAASIGSAAFVVCDSVPVLGTLKPIVAGLTEICTTVQTIRSNKQLVAEILRDVREYFRMVLRKVKRSPTAQENEELRRDMEGLFRNLQEIQETLLKLRRKRGLGLRSVLFVKRDSDNLAALQRRVQHARSTFEAGLVVSISTAVCEIVRLQMMSLTTSNEPLRVESPKHTTLAGSASSEFSVLPQIDAAAVVLAPESHSLRVFVEIDLDRASHKYTAGSSPSAIAFTSTVPVPSSSSMSFSSLEFHRIPRPSSGKLAYASSYGASEMDLLPRLWVSFTQAAVVINNTTTGS
ncbi:hypothetical protein BT96DRAFT_1023191 [Gymnopus androsaceus JB14]|uniref:Uncharacterized protein n=1 Tax=Gymnopus androsaceus JB14 TaxID=1447944 RepID=A0A6A4H5X8_9AGAR|nr:hypothetical protein BT96DRAFT_1023191 [Gymnopus androsaceus JB14]